MNIHRELILQSLCLGYCKTNKEQNRWKGTAVYEHNCEIIMSLKTTYAENTKNCSCAEEIKADLHGTTLSHMTSLRQAYCNFRPITRG